MMNPLFTIININWPQKNPLNGGSGVGGVIKVFISIGADRLL